MITADFFVASIAKEVMQAERDRLPFDSADVAEAMKGVTQEVLVAAKKAYDIGDDELGDALLCVLDDLAPSPGTGAFDGFWSSLRALQPGKAGVENPLYANLKFKQPVMWGGDADGEEHSEILEDLIHNSAAHLIGHL